MPSRRNAAFLTLSGISKRYGGVRALEGVDFACERGKIHAVLGENGAGKSTLIKIIAGVVQPDAGSMRLAGDDVSFATPVGRQRGRRRLHLPGTVADARPVGRGQHLDRRSPPRRFGLIDAQGAAPPRRGRCWPRSAARTSTR